jgi:hypothetical protein
MNKKDGCWLENKMMEYCDCCECHNNEEDDMYMGDCCDYSNCGVCKEVKCEWHCDCECHKRCNENHK